MAQGDIYQAKFKSNVGRHPSAFTLHYEEVSAASGDSDDGCEALDVALEASASGMHFFLATDCTFEGWEVRKLTGAACPPAFSQLADNVGLRAGQSVPLTKAMVVRLNQTEGMARHNGRVFVAGISEDDTTINRISSQNVLDSSNTYFQNLQALDVQSGGLAWDFHMVVVQRQAGGGIAETYPVTAITSSNILGNQRKRRTNEFGTSVA